jgi:hypothetical protein
VVAIYLQKTVHEGLWARRMALFFVQLLILTVLLHRFGTLATPAAMNLMAVSIGGLFLAIIVAVVGLVRIWFGGQIGAAQAFTGIAIALVGLAVPLFFLSQYFLLPQLNDIQTTRQAMEFKQLAAMRPADANRIVEPDLAAAEEREKAYPDIRPMELERSVTETFDIVHEAVKRLGWTIVLSGPHRSHRPHHDHGLHRRCADPRHRRRCPRLHRCPLGVALRQARSRRQCRAYPRAVCGSEVRAGEGREDRAGAG